ncbi:flagellar hook-associated protein 2 [Clostridiales bacterium oral taxon 876 str. F0540]|nr:flagellar hook-associated protein 2 [Clostridiales bacterium oral taxon 876 str. F0540]
MSDVSSSSSTGVSTSGNLLRITGMATGLDIDGMVKKMMAAEQSKVDKVKKDRQIIAWRQEAYQDIIKDLKDLQSKFFDSTAADKYILGESNFTPYTISGGNAAIASLAASNSAKAGNYTLNVTSLAEGGGVNETLSGINLSTKLTDKDSTLNTVLNLKMIVNGNPLSLSIDNTSGNMTFSDLIDAINTQGGGNIKASFSELSSKFTLATTQTGTSSIMNITSATSSSNLLNFLGIKTALKNDTDKPLNGKNADFTLVEPGDSTAYHLTDKTSNSFTLDGINYNLVGTGTTTFSLSQDTDKVYGKIKDFIDQYNEIVDKIQTKLYEKKSYSFPPLTDSQKSSMSEDDVSNWNNKAKLGILRNDDNLEKLLTNMREAFSTAVTDSGLSIGKYASNSIGIDFSTDYNKPSHIDIIDPTKLKTAIAQKGTQLLKMFTNASSTALSGTYEPTNTTYKEDGIFTRVKKILESNVGFTNVYLNNSTLTKFANFQDDYSLYGFTGTNTLPDQLYQKDNLIKTMLDTLNTKQEAYYTQFSKLETAMNSLNQQQAYLAQQFGG